MKKKTLFVLSIVLVLISLNFVLAQSPTINEIIEATEKINKPSGLFGFLQSLLTGEVTPTLQECFGDCTSLDCNPCAVKDLEMSTCYWREMDAPAYTHFSLDSYCSDPLTSDSFAKVCYCYRPKNSCLGGLQTGEFKCSDEGWLFVCNDEHILEFVEECALGCEDGKCLSIHGQPVIQKEIDYPLIISTAVVILFAIILTVILIRRRKKR